MTIQKVGVVGCGLMGSGIAQVAAAAGFHTVVREVSGEIVEKGLQNIDKNLARLVEKGALDESKKCGNPRAVDGDNGARGSERL